MKVTIHPNGFLKVVIADLPDGGADRLHVWDQPHTDSDIHQHRADFTSTVVRGLLVEEIYDWVPDPDGDHDWMRVNCWTDDAGEYHVDVHETVRCRVAVARTEIHRAGKTYKRDAHDLHKAIAVEVPLVTMPVFGPVYNQVHTMIRKRPDHH